MRMKLRVALLLRRKGNPIRGRFLTGGPYELVPPYAPFLVGTASLTGSRGAE